MTMHRRPAHGRLIAATALTLAALLFGATGATAAPGDTSLAIDFGAAGYTPGEGAPAGQNGWNTPITDFDVALVENTDYPDSGLTAGRSLQLSNAVLPPSHRYLTSPVIASAGESGTGAAYNTFETEFTVTSATGGVQDGLNVDVALDGASRYGGVVNLRHTPAGLQIGSYWLPADAISADLDAWRSATFATVPAEVSHRIRIVAFFLDDQPDVLQVYVDGTLVSGDASPSTWEVYHDVTGAATDAVVDQVTFKTSPSRPTADGIGFEAAPAAPATNDLGFLFGDIAYSVRVDAPPVPATEPTLPAAPDPAPDTTVTLSASTVTHGEVVNFSADGFLPYENVYLTYFSTPLFGGWFQADAAGRVSGSITLPNLEAGTHTLQLSGPFSGNIAAIQLVVLALAESGRDQGPIVGVAALVLLVGGVLLVAARRDKIRRPTTGRVG